MSLDISFLFAFWEGTFIIFSGGNENVIPPVKEKTRRQPQHTYSFQNYLYSENLQEPLSLMNKFAGFIYLTGEAASSL